VSNFKYKLKTDIAIFEIKKEPLGLWDLWVNSMPTLTFESPEDAVNAVINKNTGYSVWDMQENLNYDQLRIENWIKIEI
tara:strand:+ start:3603 stop:3839 length:237 start_codon:yes stop_codon:yes gene_type:complete